MVTELVLSVIALVGLALLVPLIMLATVVLGPRSTNPAKEAPYESGIKRMIGLAEQKFSVKFYLLAILFLLFDIEMVFMYPWAVVFREFMAQFGPVILWSMLSFVIILMVGYIYAIKKGALDWSR